MQLVESYKSLNEALMHGGVANDAGVDIKHIDAEDIEQQGADKILAQADAILVAPGFGARGTEGKIAAVRYARERGVPFFGICLGMQLAVVEFARHVCGLAGRQLVGDRAARPRIRSSTSCRTSAASPTRARPCGWAPTPAC